MTQGDTPEGGKHQPLWLRVCQNNVKRSVKIKKVSEAMAEKLGYLRSEMEGEPLHKFLGRRAADSLKEYLDFSEDGDDVDAILKRVAEFRLRHHSGEEIAFAKHCERESPPDQHHWFSIVLKDERRQREDRSLEQLLRANLQGVIAIEETSGLADRTSCERYLQQIQNYVASHGVSATFAVIRLDRYNKSCAQYGQNSCEQLIKHVASQCKAKFREEDMVSRLSQDRLGLLLLDITEDAARIVLNRLRWFIASHQIAFGGKANFSVTISIAFGALAADIDILSRCEQAIEEIGAEERSQLVQA